MGAKNRAKHKLQRQDLGMPTPERLRHDTILELRPMPGAVTRRKQSPLDRYRELGKDGAKGITQRQFDAGTKLVEDYELGIIGARDPEARGGSGPPTPISLAQIMAAQSYQLAVQAIGKRVSAVVLPVCCAEMSVKDLAERMRADGRHVMGQLKMGLDMLADHYEM